MKRFIYIIALLLCANTMVLAQLAGKKFIRGSAMINFDNQEYKDFEADITNTYGYSFDIVLGNFKKEDYATGWLIGNSLKGGKLNYSLYVDGNNSTVVKSGINEVGVSLGRFWHFYKAFNDKLGIYGGPDVRLSYNGSNDYRKDESEGDEYLIQRKYNTVSVSLGLKGSLYYAMSERWWIEASIGYANPFLLKYTKGKGGREGDLHTKITNWEYEFSPQLTIPSVGLGLRYFLK